MSSSTWMDCLSYLHVIKLGQNALHIVCDDEIQFDEAMEIVATLLKYGSGAMMSHTNQARSVMLCGSLSFEMWVVKLCRLARQSCKHLRSGSLKVAKLR